MLEQGIGFDRLAPNIIVKFPATSVGVRVMEEATYRGVNVNATVSFSVAQAVAAAEAVERGLRRREAEGLPVDGMGPVITLMMGRLEDWLRVQTERDGIVADPTALPWSGVAVFKRAYAEFTARGLRARLLGAAIRHHLHWSELIGGDVVITMPAVWQRRFNASSVEVRPRMDEPVAPAIVDELRTRFPDFVRAFEPDGLSPEEFDTFGPTARTLRAFTGSYHELLHQVADALVPNPDVRPAMTEPADPSERPAQRPPARPASPPARRARARSRSIRRPPAGGTCRSGPCACGAGESVAIGGPDHETAVVPAVRRRRGRGRDGERAAVLEGRASVFDGAALGVLPAGRPDGDGRQSGRTGGPPTTLAIATAPTRPDVSARPPARSTSGPRTSASRSAAPATRRARSTTSSPPTSRPTGCCSSRS